MNATARLVYQTSRYDHIIPLLCRQHWLRVPQRISFKLAVMVYQYILGLDRLTWPTPFSQSPGFPVDNACGHCRRRHWTSRLHDCPLSATERFPSPQHEHSLIIITLARY